MPITTPIDQIEKMTSNMMVSLSCSLCNKPFQRKKVDCSFQYGFDNRKFYCSKQCQYKVKTKKDLIDVKCCKNCNKGFTPKYIKQLFCSKSCSNKGVIRRTKTLKKCSYEQCNEYVEYSFSKFCKKCKTIGRHHSKINNGKLYTEITLGEYLQNKSDRNCQIAGPNKFDRIRGYARSMFNNIKQKQCVRCGWAHHVEVCHIKPISSFSETALISEINDINNLILLCPNCHWLHDHNLSEFKNGGSWGT